MSLDIRSLIAAAGAICALSAAVTGLCWRRTRGRIAGPGQWFAGSLAMLAGTVLIAARGRIPDLFSVVAGNTAVLTGGACQIWGVGRFLGLARSRCYSALAAAVAVAAPTVAVFCYALPDVRLRVMAVSLGFAAECGIGALMLAANPRAASQPAGRTAAAFFIGFGLLFILRSGGVFLIPAPSDYFDYGSGESALLLAITALVTAIAFAELHLVNNRLFADLLTAAASLKRGEHALREANEARADAESRAETAAAEILLTQKEIMVTLSEVVENRSEETAHHVIRVSEYARILSASLGLPPEDIALIADAAPMHDIGKIAVPDSVLKKPGPLGLDELEQMRAHTTIGRDILASSHRKLLRTAAVIAYEHHEYWDGSGYPEGKSGLDISLPGRIVAVCDVFDALAVARVYKPAWDLDHILEFFRIKRGSMFEPELVDLLVAKLDRFLAVSRTFPDPAAGRSGRA